MLQGSRTKIYDSVEEAINAAVMGVKKWRTFLDY
jgi:hypothetical protein